MRFTITFEFKAEKKHSVRYDELGDRREQKLGAIYIRKIALQKLWPRVIEVTVEDISVP